MTFDKCELLMLAKNIFLLFHKKSLTDSKLLNGTVYSTLDMVTGTEHPIPFIAIVACSTDFNFRGAISEFSVL